MIVGALSPPSSLFEPRHVTLGHFLVVEIVFGNKDGKGITPEHRWPHFAQANLNIITTLGSAPSKKVKSMVLVCLLNP